MAKINIQKYLRYLDFAPLAFDSPDMLVRSQKLFHVVSQDLNIVVDFTVLLNPILLTFVSFVRELIEIKYVLLS